MIEGEGKKGNQKTITGAQGSLFASISILFLSHFLHVSSGRQFSATVFHSCLIAEVALPCELSFLCRLISIGQVERDPVRERGIDTEETSNLIIDLSIYLLLLMF